MSYEFINNASNKARVIMEKHHNEINRIYFGSFPSGSCGNTSEILAQYFISNKINNIKYVSGTRGESSHAWLEYKEYIIDITSDQFKDGVGSVYVGVNKDFHSTFTNQCRVKPIISSYLMSSYIKFAELMS